MAERPWDDVGTALGAVGEILAAGPDDGSNRLSHALGDLIPHQALAVLAGSCSRSPMTAGGAAAITGRLTSADLARLAGMLSVGQPFQGRVAIAGAERPVVAVAASAGESGALLVLIRADGEPDATVEALDIVTRVWTLVAGRLDERLEDARPTDLSASRIAAGERARVAAELSHEHGAVLSALLGTLRAANLGDGAARRAATDLAASALVELRSSAERERELGDERVGTAFERLRDELGPLVRYSSAELELVTPEGDRMLPAPIVQAARAIVRGAVLNMLEQDGVKRIRVGWQVGADLVVSVLDDGPGGLAGDALATQSLHDRAEAVDGALDIESVPGWGTRLSARLPLGPAAENVDADPLARLHPRELEVLEQLARGQRNRQIAETLGISENTVKFHVTNVLSKLGAHSRGEAAAIAHAAGLEAPRTAALS